jgi:hypothetical protein
MRPAAEQPSLRLAVRLPAVSKGCIGEGGRAIRVGGREYERGGRLEANGALLGSSWCAERRRWFAEAQPKGLRLHVRIAGRSGVSE